MLGGCSTDHYIRAADRQVYALVDAAMESVTGQAKPFDVNRPADTTRTRLLMHGGVLRLTLRDALDVASENNRNYQTQREALYLAGLALTGALNDFEFQWFAGSAADVDGVGGDDASLQLQDDLSASVNTLSGATIVASFVQNFFRTLVSGTGTQTAFTSSSLLSLNLTQPLLRNYGARINRENLTQAERNLVYQVRTFERFRAELAVDVFTSYLTVLQQLQNLQNQERNARSREQSEQNIVARYEAGRDLTKVDRDRATQATLAALDSLQQARNSVEASLDNLKLILGLPTDALLEVDLSELVVLENIGVVPIDLDPDAAIDLALARRFQYRTALDQVEDAVRNVLIAEDGLDPNLDLTAALSVPSADDEPFKLDPANIQWAAGINLDLPFERTAARNTYRSSLVAMNAQIRGRENLEDTIKLQIRSALRDVGVAYRTFRIQEQAVELAQSRVASTGLLLKAGRANVLDEVDSQDSLISAQLSRTQALVNYTIARIELLRDLEALSIEPKGLRFDRSLPLPPMPTDFWKFGSAAEDADSSESETTNR